MAPQQMSKKLRPHFRNERSGKMIFREMIFAQILAISFRTFHFVDLTTFRTKMWAPFNFHTTFTDGDVFMNA